MSKKSVFVVDDEMDICETIRDELGEYTVEMAYSYDQAHAKLLKGTYDCVVLDIMGVNGYELLEEFGKKFSIIILTGQKAAPEFIQKAMKLNAKLYLPKDQLWMIEDYVSKVINASGSLWGWLFNKVPFGKLMGVDFKPEQMLAEVEEEKKDAGGVKIKFQTTAPAKKVATPAAEVAVPAKPAPAPAPAKPAPAKAKTHDPFEAWAKRKKTDQVPEPAKTPVPATFAATPAAVGAAAPSAAPAAAPPRPTSAPAPAKKIAPGKSDDELLADLLDDLPDLGS